MEIADKKERAQTFIDMVGRPITDKSFDDAYATYLEMGGGDENDVGSTLVDILADVGHWMEGTESITDVTKRLQNDEAVPDYHEALIVHSLIRFIGQRLAAARMNPMDAACSADNHVEAEQAEEAAADGMNL